MKNFIAPLFVLFLFCSCEPSNRTFVEHKELSPDVEWLKKDFREFKVPVEDNSVAYNLGLSFRYATGYQYETAKVKVTEISPSGKESVNEYDLKVREKNGDYIGEPGFDIWDSEHVIQPNKKFEEKGTYTYKLEQNNPTDPMVFVMEIGVILDKAK